ncbi:caspase family protein [Hoeflea sp.]|uniref:caspase family protein n=1 Tax=Hoeflea sp. TaxID=1940281 RepID=UPI003A8DE905
MKNTDSIKQIVILLHGIRTRAWWQGTLTTLIESETDSIVIPIKYGRFDLFRFILPFYFLKNPTISKIEKRIEDTIDQFPDAKITIIAHSFGTYALSEILFRNPRIRLNRIVLCGAIIRNDFPWDRLYSQIADTNSRSSIINECGLRDIWPLAAQSLTWGYGSSGVDGFGTVGVRDRFHDLGHSDFLTEEFARTYWLPLIEANDFAISAAEAAGQRPASLLGLLRIPYRYFFAAIVAFGVFAAVNTYIGPIVGWNNIAHEMAITPGLAKASAPTRSLVMYATSPGAAALDANNVDGQTSPFSYALSGVWNDGETAIDQMVAQVTQRVASQTKGSQVPHYDNKLGVNLDLADSRFMKIAVVVGNADYSFAARLDTPISDVTAISKSFRDLGFLTMVVTDATRAALLSAIEDVATLTANSRKPVVMAFYYAGHGFQIEQTNYLLPIDADIDIDGKADAASKAIPIASILAQLQSSVVQYMLVFLDACRNDPFSVVPLAQPDAQPISPVTTEYEGFSVFLDNLELAARVNNIFHAKCTECHSETGRYPDLRDLSTIADDNALIFSSQPQKSKLIEVLQDSSAHPDVNILRTEIEVLKCWISRGGPVNRYSHPTRGLVIVPANSYC